MIGKTIDIATESIFHSGKQVPDEYLERLNGLLKHNIELSIFQKEIYEANRERADKLGVDSITKIVDAIKERYS